MSRPAAAALLAGALALGAAGVAHAAGPLKPPPPDGAGGQMGTHAAPGPWADGAMLVTFADAPARRPAERRLAGLGSVAPVLPEAGIWRLTPAGPPAAARGRVLARPGVAAAEWSLARHGGQAPPPGPPDGVLRVTDPLFTAGTQWGLTDAAAPGWTPELTTVGPRARIAILDSGVDRSHEEWRGPPSPLVAPRSTLQRSADATDWGLGGHGTHVAGIAAAPLNGIGIVGVAPSGPRAGEVIPVRIADPDGRSTDTTMIAGIRWAVLRGARVINISAGGPGFSRAFQDTVLWATQRGALVVASVGNDGGGTDGRIINYPAGYERVVGVGAQCDRARSPDCPRAYGLARFSNRNTSVDLIAPGVRILSTVPRRVDEDVLTPGYAFKDGTSMAAPYVTGVAALVQAANGNRLSPYQVLRQLQNTARRIEPGGRNNRSGYGVVNPARAIQDAPPPDDADEVNDDIKWTGRPRVPAPERPVRIVASADALHDADDVYPIRVARGDRIQVSLAGRSGVLDLYLWRPGTRTVETSDVNVRRNLLAFRGGPARVKRVTHVARRAGVHHVNVFARRGRGDYTLVITVRR
jgi:hypothetical protein